MIGSHDMLDCGHHVSLMRTSAETGENLFCELCDCRNALADAESMEKRYRAEADAYRILLQEAVEGFSRVLVGTSDQERVYGWVRRVKECLRSWRIA
jgi:hypothetical protein